MLSLVLKQRVAAQIQLSKLVTLCKVSRKQPACEVNSFTPLARFVHKVLRRLNQGLIAGLVEERNGDPGAAGVCIDHSVRCGPI